MLQQSSMMLDTHSNTTSAIVSQVGRWVTVCQYYACRNTRCWAHSVTLSPHTWTVLAAKRNYLLT